jgi:GNAT superfamily N-acetyltransferase
MIEIHQVGEEYLSIYDSIPMQVTVNSILEIDEQNSGILGIKLIEKPVNEYVKDLSKYEVMAGIAKQFDISNWVFLMAFINNKPIGAATALFDCPKVNMLSGRNDISVLWDLRVDDNYKGIGIGTKLLEEVKIWSREKGLKKIKIECQNTNVSACKFYQKSGAYLGAIDKYAYCRDKEIENEIQLIWYIDLQ